MSGIALISIMDEGLSVQNDNFKRWTEGKKKYLAAGFIVLLALILSIFFIQYFSGHTFQSQALRQDTDIGLLLLGGNDGGQNDSVSLVTGSSYHHPKK